MRPFTNTVPAGERVSIAADGDTIYLQETTGSLRVSARQTGNDSDGRDLLSRVIFSEKSKQRTRGTFNQVEVVNETGSSVTFTFIMGFGDYDEPPTAVLTETPNGVAGGRVTANAAGVQVVTANANRKRIAVMATWDGANGAFLAGSQADAVAGDGIELQPGVGFIVETTAELWVARDGGSDVEVSYLEETFT